MAEREGRRDGTKEKGESCFGVGRRVPDCFGKNVTRMQALSEQWVQVYCGPMAMAQMLCEVLSSRGIPAFVPNRNLVHNDMSSVGGNVLDARVLVAREEHEAANAIVARETARELDAAGVAALAAEESDAERAVQRIGRRVAYSVVIPLFAPFGLWQAWHYFRAARALPRAPRSHGLVIAATGFAALECVALAVSLAFGFGFSLVWF